MARVTSKGDKRETKSGGSLFKMEMMDVYGTKIEACFFGASADNWERKLVEDKVYLFSNGQVKMANKRFTSVNNDFCLVFEKTATIVEVEDDGTIL